MDKLKEKLNNPFDGLNPDNEESFQEECKKIATNLFNSYYIKCGEEQYFFAEIEFYYYQKGKWEKDWNRVTYPRDGYSASNLFYHLSGVDICFDSSFEKRKFGGILIRSIVNSKNNVTAGPWNCMLLLLNSCKGSSMPSIEKLKESRNITPKAIHRALGEKDMVNFENNNHLKLCFYDDTIDNWKTKRVKYTKNQKGVDDTIKEDYTKYNRFK